MIRQAIILSLFFFPIPSLMMAQAQPKDTARLKPPKLESFWGLNRGGRITLEAAVPLLDSSVIVIADKKEKLPVAKALLVYRSKDLYEDEATGTLKSRYNSYSCSFKYNDRLPENWKKFLKENMKPGDQLLFADIHVKSKNGYLFAAPDIRFIIE
jgi:hypothetical protein